MAVSYNTKTKRFRVEFDKVINGQRIRKTKLLPKGISEQDANAYDESYQSELYKGQTLYKKGDNWINFVSSIKTTWISNTIKHIRYRAKQKNIDCEIDANILEAMLVATGGRCELTGIQFNSIKINNRSPYLFSVDRIDSKKGYTKNNCRIICYSANVALQNWGENVFNDISVGYVFNKYSAYYRKI